VAKEHRRTGAFRLPSGAGYDRPRERLARAGVGALSDAELLQILLGSGARGRTAAQIADALLAATGGLAGVIDRSVQEWLQLPGLGPAKATRLVATFELGRRALESTPRPAGPLATPEAALSWLRPQLLGRRDERVSALLLDGRRRPLEVVEVARGDPCRVALSPAAVFRPALRTGADAIVLAHNHPSGDPTPSARDRETTRTLQRAGALLGVTLEAHFVVAGNAVRRV
jgi:DNA repair protein RadC